MKAGVMYFFTTGLKGLIEADLFKLRHRPDKANQFLTQIADKIEFYKREIKKIPAGPRRARAVFEALDSMKAESEKESPEFWNSASCKAGCAACCHTTVLLTLDEGELLADAVESGRVDVDMARLERQAQFKGDELAYWRAPKELTRCVFLGADNRCQVYSERPASCRKYHVGSPPAQCDDRQDRDVMVLAHYDSEILATAAADICRNADPLPLTLWKILERRKTSRAGG